MKALRGHRGTSLIEMLVVLALMGTVVSVSGTSLFQALKHGNHQQGMITSVHSVQNAADWVVQDSQMAQSTNLVDDEDPVSTLILSWTDWSQGGGVPHSVTYGLSGTELLRTYDGQTLTVGHYVTSVGFSISGQAISVTITSEGRPGVSDTKTYRVYLRPTR